MGVAHKAFQEKSAKCPLCFAYRIVGRSARLSACYRVVTRTTMGRLLDAPFGQGYIKRSKPDIDRLRSCCITEARLLRNLVSCHTW